MRRSVIAVAAAVALLAAACQDDGDVEPIEPDDQAVEPSEPEEPEPEPEPQDEELEDPFAVPDEIDVDYAQQVFDELFRIVGDANRLAYDQRDEIEFVPTDALDLLRSVSADEDYFLLLSEGLQSAVDDDFAGRRTPIEDRSFTVQELSRATADCIVAAGEVDFRVTAEDPRFEVLPHSYLIVPDDVNVTGWSLQDSTAVIDGFEPLDPDEVCP